MAVPPTFLGGGWWNFFGCNTICPLFILGNAFVLVPNFQFNMVSHPLVSKFQFSIRKMQAKFLFHIHCTFCHSQVLNQWKSLELIDWNQTRRILYKLHVISLSWNI